MSDDINIAIDDPDVNISVDSVGDTNLVFAGTDEVVIGLNEPDELVIKMVVLGDVNFTMTAKGDRGEPGEKGDIGDQGEPGIPGEDGAPGADGKSAYEIWIEDGNTGTIDDFLDSLKGEQGDQGLPGNDGAPGAPGAKGDKGDTGDPGTPGVDGTDGIDGTDGADGLSAYQVWLNLGNVGSETDFINSLKGADGTDGIDGTDGADGVGLPLTANNNDSVFYNSGTGMWEAQPLEINLGKPTDAYALSNMDSSGGTYNYFGYEDKDGNWYIKRWTLATDVFTFFAGVSAYATGWTDRATHTYASYEDIF